LRSNIHSNGSEYLSDCKHKDNTPFTLQEFCIGRDHESFNTFFRYFVPAIVAKNKFKSRLFSPMSGDSHLCSISDEACTLLLLENSYDRWMDVHKNKIEGSTAVDRSVEGRDEKRKRKWESDVSPKYTEGGIVYSDNRLMSHKGWKDAGIRRFNSLCQHVRKDRAEYPNLLTELVSMWKEDMHHSKKKPIEAEAFSTEAYHELWDDEPRGTAVETEQVEDTAI
jgi:hypothetical protein